MESVLTYLHQAAEERASDLFLVAGKAVSLKIKGVIRPIREERAMPAETESLVRDLYQLARRPIDQYLATGDDDFSLSVTGLARFRVSAYRQRGSTAAVIRVVSFGIPDWRQMEIPEEVMKIAGMARGMVLVTGPAGGGKSTTLAAILDHINQTRRKHILTLEDPVEYVYTPAKCVINQREIGRDTKSFANGLRAALREDPDVILVGEMRDLDTIETALTAAETGHLVFGTVHTNSAADSIDRIVDVFPANRQQQIRLQLSMTLKAVLSQQLLPRKSGSGRVLACEVMKTDGAIRNLIREGKTPQIYNAIQTTGSVGNILMDKALQNLFNAGEISRDVCESALRDPAQAKSWLPPAGGGPGQPPPPPAPNRYKF